MNYRKRLFFLMVLIFSSFLAVGPLCAATSSTGVIELNPLSPDGAGPYQIQVSAENPDGLKHVYVEIGGTGKKNKELKFYLCDDRLRKINVPCEGTVFNSPLSADVFAGAVPGQSVTISLWVDGYRGKKAMVDSAVVQFPSSPVIFSNNGHENGATIEIWTGDFFDPGLVAYDFLGNDITADIVCTNTVDNQQPGLQQSTCHVTSYGETSFFELNVDVRIPLPIPTTIEYTYQTMADMPDKSRLDYLNLSGGESIQQSFTLRADDFINSYTKNGGEGMDTVSITEITLALYGFFGTPSTFRLEIYEGDISQEVLIISQEFQHKQYRYKVKTFPFDEIINLNLNTTYTFKFTHVIAGQSYYSSFPGTIRIAYASDNYPDGRSTAPEERDLWFRVNGAGALPQYEITTINADLENKYFFDSKLGYQLLNSKLLAIDHGNEEALIVENPIGYPLTYVIDDPSIAGIQMIDTTMDDQDKVFISGIAEGTTYLFVKAYDRIVDTVRLQSFMHRVMKLSYAYIAYPGETDHPLKYAGNEVTAYISDLYARANIGIEWTDNGIIEFDWDLNGDTGSWTKSHDEMWSPLDQGVLPDPDQYFSNVYVIRAGKDDSYHGQANGGGTSRGFGETASPPRGAMVRAHLFRTPASLGDTLAHEIGHNLGLSHVNYWVPDHKTNLMHVGRQDHLLWSGQWHIIHNILKMRAPLEPGVVEP